VVEEKQDWKKIQRHVRAARSPCFVLIAHRTEHRDIKSSQFYTPTIHHPQKKGGGLGLCALKTGVLN
jgi:hypothetical protein